MDRLSHTSDIFSSSLSINASEINYAGLDQQDVDPSSASGPGNGIQQSMDSVNTSLSTGQVAIGSSILQTTTEDGNRNFYEQIDEIFNLVGNEEILERNTRRRVTAVDEQGLPSSSFSSILQSGNTSLILQPSYPNWFSTSSPGSSSVSSDIFGRNYATREEEENMPISPALHTELDPGTERRNSGQNAIASGNFPINHGSQDAFFLGASLNAPSGIPQNNINSVSLNSIASSIRQDSTLGFSYWNMVANYAAMLLNTDQTSMNIASSGLVRQTSSQPIPSNRGRRDPRLGNSRTFQAPSRTEFVIARDGRDAVRPSTQPLPQPSIAAQWRDVESSTELLTQALVSPQSRVVGSSTQTPLLPNEPEEEEWEEEEDDPLGDMRFDVDDMTYEELLALGEHMGNVGTGLTEEEILAGIKQYRFYSVKSGPTTENEMCCICQEDYADGEEIGKLDCRHMFHSSCIIQWLMQKNRCPICKATAVVISKRDCLSNGMMPCANAIMVSIQFWNFLDIQIAKLAISICTTPSLHSLSICLLYSLASRFGWSVKE